MPYVQRDDEGNITGCFANPQPGFAEEYLPDDDAEVVDFLEGAERAAAALAARPGAV